jgi:thiamine-monophosphate kinase
MSSEFSFIHEIRQRASNASANLILGIGDDTAIWREQAGCERLITTDLLIEDVHFKLDYTPLACLGHKTLAVSLSDIAAMGGKPEFALLSLGIPKSQISNPAWQDFFDSYFILAEKHGVTLIGGDTSSSPDKLVIDSIVIGSCAPGTALRRSGAQVGDAIYITGELGASATGLALLLRGERYDEAADDLRQAAIRAHLLPEPRLALAQRLPGLVHAMMDVSDGLAQDLSHICEESNVDAILIFDAVPIAESVRLSTTSADAAFSLAISGGEDYELLLTANPDNEEALMSLAAECELRLTRIGEIIARHPSQPAPQLFLRTVTRVDLLAVTGYDHFRT